MTQQGDWMKFAFSRDASGNVPSAAGASLDVCFISEHLKALLLTLFSIKHLVTS